MNNIKNENESSYNIYYKIDTIINSEESMNVITKQEQEIARLKSELNSVKTERDLLICEVSKLKFEKDIADLKRLYSKRSSEKGRNSNGSIINSIECNDDCNDDEDEEMNGDIDNIVEEDLINNYKTMTSIADPYEYQWHARPNNNTIRNNSSELINYSRTTNRYELSQDLLEKQIELLERKYGGTKARDAAVTIQKAFRRYMLIKKFAYITAMAKAEKRLSRRFQVLVEGNSNSGHAQTEFTCDAKNSACLQANVTPIRSLSMREKRLSELENGTNSLPRTYAGRYTDCNYCCATVPNTCSPCYLSTQPMNVCANAYYVKNHLGSAEMVRNYQSHLSNCNHTSPVAVINYQVPVCQKKYNGQYLYQSPSPYQVSSSMSQMSTPVRKVPPEVPKRTSSISLKSNESNQSLLSNSDISFSKTTYSGSLSSVQSSGSDSSSTMNASHSSSLNMPNYSLSTSWNKKPQVTETVRKRQYRVGLNLFNKKPEKGISYLMRKGFLDSMPQAVAKFLIARKGLSKQMIGEYLGNVQNQFNSAVLEFFVNELDLSGMQIDVALRKYQTYFRMPGEAQKIERLMEVFSQRYCQCNRDVVSRFRSLDTVFVLAFATIMLNTDLHTPNLKPDKKIKLEEFIKNLRGVDDCCDMDRDMLVGIYERIKANEFKPGNDHVSQVMKVQSTIVGKKLMLALPHRRLVCYCRLYEVLDINKKERSGVHQREVFLFNDLLVITKILSKKKNSCTYTFRQNFSLSGLHAAIFQTQYYPYGIQLTQRVDNQVLITFNARNDHDRTKFVEDIRESILEMDEMENLRIEAELERQKSSRTTRCNSGNSTENRDSGVADVEICQCLHGFPQSSRNHDSDAKHSTSEQHSSMLKRSALSNSLLDIHDQDERPQRSGSVGSLDSGMSVSFQLTRSLSRNNAANKQRLQQVSKCNVVAAGKAANVCNASAAASVRNQAFLANLFTKNLLKNSAAE